MSYPLRSVGITNHRLEHPMIIMNIVNFPFISIRFEEHGGEYIVRYGHLPLVYTQVNTVLRVHVHVDYTCLKIKITIWYFHYKCPGTRETDP